MDSYYRSRLNPNTWDPNTGKPHSMHPVKRAFAVAPWHQPLGRNAGQDADHPLINMHAVIGSLYYAQQNLPTLLAEALDELDDVVLTSEQIQEVAADRKSTRLKSSDKCADRMPSYA